MEEPNITKEEYNSLSAQIGELKVKYEQLNKRVTHLWEMIEGNV